MRRRKTWSQAAGPRIFDWARRLSRTSIAAASQHHCHDPDITAGGFLFGRQAILEYIFHQHKKETSLQEVARCLAGGAQRAAAAVAQDQVRGFLEEEATSVGRPFTSMAASGNRPDDAWPTSKDKHKPCPASVSPPLTRKATKLEKQSSNWPASHIPKATAQVSRELPAASRSVDQVGLICTTSSTCARSPATAWERRRDVSPEPCCGPLGPWAPLSAWRSWFGRTW